MTDPGVQDSERISVTTVQLIAAQIGNVRTHAKTRSRVTPQRTADTPRVAPTPMTAVEIVCVVLSGIPRREAISIVVAAAVSAANPWCVW